MFSARSWQRRASVVLAVLAVTATGPGLAAPAEAANRVTPGSFTGYGFDTCIAPAQKVMNRWLNMSPYWAVGIYIAGASRGCPYQENLTSEWVATQLHNRWRLLPLTVGRQASCTTVERYRSNRISADPTRRYAKAREQGRVEASTTVRAAKALGIRQGSTLWYDIEHFDIGRTRCRESALGFLSAWTHRLHVLGYVSGVYSSASSGIRMLDQAEARTPRAYSMPDRVWIADWNGRANLDSSYIRADSWTPHRRVHQYRGGHQETYGGVTVNIDSNYLSLGRGSVAPKAPGFCGVRVDFPRYQRLLPGQRDVQVKALQCLLRKKDFFHRDLTRRYTRATERAVRRFQRSRSLAVTGRTSRSTWTAILSEGWAPVSKIGSASHAVRRIQRALNASTDAALEVTGVFGPATTKAVRAYQKERGLRRTGVVAEATWTDLEAGRL